MKNDHFPLITSIVLHVIILTALIVSVEFKSQTPVLENNNSKVLNAIVLDSANIQMPHPTPPAPSAKPQPVKKTLPPPPEPIKKPVEVKKTPVPEPKVKEAIAIPKKPQKIKKEVLQKQLLAELEEVKKLNKKKHQELEKAFQRELKTEAAKKLEQQLLAEKNRAVSAAQAQKMSGIVDKYKALILQSIAQQWLVPPGVNKSLSAQLLIRIAPGGVVLDVQLVKSSGDEALDRSARTAVFKASPLPVPTDLEEFDPFRQFILKVKPENVVSRDSDLVSAQI